FAKTAMRNNNANAAIKATFVAMERNSLLFRRNDDVFIASSLLDRTVGSNDNNHQISAITNREEERAPVAGERTTGPARPAATAGAPPRPDRPVSHGQGGADRATDNNLASCPVKRRAVDGMLTAWSRNSLGTVRPWPPRGRPIRPHRPP